MIVHVVLVFHDCRYVETPLLIGAGDLDYLESELDSKKPQQHDSTPPNLELVPGIPWVDDNLWILAASSIRKT